MAASGYGHAASRRSSSWIELSGSDAPTAKKMARKMAAEVRTEPIAALGMDS
jgi:hypothetical protein